MSIKQDVKLVKELLPSHYEVKESSRKGSIHCVSRTGLRTTNGNDDDKTFDAFFKTVKSKFGERFQELFHNTCAYHCDFTIYLK